MGLLPMVAELLVALSVVLALAKFLGWVVHTSTKPCVFNYIPISQAHDPSKVLVVDCTPSKKQITITHHKEHHNPHGLRPSDTTTGLILNALKAGYLWGGEVHAYVQRPHVTTNHFDTDSFLSVWCYINRTTALQHEPVLRHMARIGDFREAFLSPELLSAHGRHDGLSSIRDAFTALKLCCWLNSMEKRLFSAPYESKDCDAKFEHFLPRFGAVLANPESAWHDWQDEYKQVVGGFDMLQQGQDCYVESIKKIGLSVVRCPEPQHYYSLFSHSFGSDVVLTVYDHGRYEVECKYSQYVCVHSRPVWPRLDMGPLARVLNSIETNLPIGTAWVANRYTDTGPLLRLQRDDAPLTKAQRYGHPHERPFASSSIREVVMVAVVASFLEFGLQGQRPKVGGWTWDELATINQGVPWNTWVNTVLEQHDKGELMAGIGSGLLLPVSPSRRMSADEHVVALSVPQGTLITPQLSDGGSSILSKEDVATLVANALPARYQQARWELAYCTQRDGISLHTLYRKAAGKAPTLLIIKDDGGYVFGAFASEAWHIWPRFYGTGETSVFQLHPMRALYHWRRLRDGTLNDFFQFSAHEGLGVGGAGHFAIWLDNDLLEGTSSGCETFGSPTLSHRPDFHVHNLELWHLH